MPFTVATKKRCVRCKQVDTTDFSSCRFCGTKYDAVIQSVKPAGTDFGYKLRSWPTLIVFLVIAVVIKAPILRLSYYIFSGGHTMSQMVDDSVKQLRDN